jgi:hypothetical protein
MQRISHDQKRELREALESAFPTFSVLRQFLMESFDDVNVPQAATSLPDCIDIVLTDLDSKGRRLDELVVRAIEYNNKDLNPKLSEFGLNHLTLINKRRPERLPPDAPVPLIESSEGVVVPIPDAEAVSPLGRVIYDPQPMSPRIRSLVFVGLILLLGSGAGFVSGWWMYRPTAPGPLAQKPPIRIGDPDDLNPDILDPEDWNIVHHEFDQMVSVLLVRAGEFTRAADVHLEIKPVPEAGSPKVVAVRKSTHCRERLNAVWDGGARVSRISVSSCETGDWVYAFIGIPRTPETEPILRSRHPETLLNCEVK